MSRESENIQPLKGMAFVAAVLCLAMANFFAILDTTIANVSVANIAGNLGTSTSQGTYVITSYAVAEAISVPLTGWLASRFGSIRVFTSCFMLFGFFSLLCGLATSLGICRCLDSCSIPLQGHPTFIQVRYTFFS
jgi:DHA2 family multidrug resistance protein